LPPSNLDDPIEDLVVRLSSSLTELHAAVRGLRRSPTIALSAVVCIGLGLGSTAAISSAVDRALVQRLPFREPGRLVTVYRTTPHFDTGPFAPGSYLDLARDARSVSQLAAIGSTIQLLALPSDAVQVRVKRVTGNLFTLLGVPPLQGRLLAPGDDRPDQAAVAVLSEDAWRLRFGADPGLVGRAIRLDGIAYTVVGILPRSFAVPHGAQVARGDIWVPMRFTPEEQATRTSNFLLVLGRLAPGASPAMAAAELGRLYAGPAEATPDLRGEGVRVLPLQAEGVRAVRAPLLLVFAAAAIVLLIAATNVTSLLLARGVQRGREIAIRAALGGTRGQVMRPAALETVVLTAAGLGLGVALAWLGVRSIGDMAAQRLPQLAGLAVNLRIVGFAVALAVVVALVAGMVPAWRGAAADPLDALSAGRGSGMGRRHHRLLNALVVAEVALSLVLLVGAGLVLRGFAGLLRQEPGFDPGRILTLQATVSADRYPDEAGVRRYLEPVLAAVRQVPGVEDAAAISLLPYDNWGWNFNVRYEGQPGDDPSRLPLVEYRIVTPEFFRVTGQRLLDGRLLEAGDGDRPGAAPVVVANEALARRDFPGQSPVGRRLYLDDTTFATIVGVVSDIRNVGPYAPPAAEIYSSFREAGAGWSSFPLVVRVRAGLAPDALAGAVSAAVRGVDLAGAVTPVRPMGDVMAESVGRPRFYLVLLGTFGGVALLLAVAGIYGVLSYAVAQRTREFGIRTALGSTPAATLGLVARQAMTLVAAGIAIGLAGSLAVTKLLTSLLYGVSPLDPPAWASATVTLVAAGLIAALLPAWRATRADPVVALRSE
jgi:putative ABC transport system permease protein